MKKLLLTFSLMLCLSSQIASANESDNICRNRWGLVPLALITTGMAIGNGYFLFSDELYKCVPSNVTEAIYLLGFQGLNFGLSFQCALAFWLKVSGRSVGFKRTTREHQDQDAVT